jgi:hypothetical protein
MGGSLRKHYDEHAAGPRDAAHLLHRPPGARHEVQRQLGERAGERAGSERQVNRGAAAEEDAGAARARPRKGEIGHREIDCMHSPAAVAALQLERQAARATADVEHRAIARQFGEVAQNLGEPAGPAAERALVGSAVVGPIANRLARAAVQSIATMTSDALITAEASWPVFSPRSSTA